MEEGWSLPVIVQGDGPTCLHISLPGLHPLISHVHPHRGPVICCPCFQSVLGCENQCNAALQVAQAQQAVSKELLWQIGGMELLPYSFHVCIICEKRTGNISICFVTYGQ